MTVRSKDMSDDVKVAWSVILPHTEKEAMRNIQTLTNVWFNQHAQTWSKSVDTESRKRSIKDEDGNLTFVITNSGSPLKEFCETSYRYRSSEFGIVADK